MLPSGAIEHIRWACRPSLYHHDWSEGNSALRCFSKAGSFIKRFREPVLVKGVIQFEHKTISRKGPEKLRDLSSEGLVIYWIAPGSERIQFFILTTRMAPNHIKSRSGPVLPPCYIIQLQVFIVKVSLFGILRERCHVIWISEDAEIWVPSFGYKKLRIQLHREFACQGQWTS